MTQPTKTTCPYCGVGCGLHVQRSETGAISVRGDPEHPANLGRLCSKGAALGETLGLDGRLLHPEIRGRRVDWDTALDQVAEGLRSVIDRHGPQAVAFYVSGQLLTEDYYVANKLIKGFIGSANIDTNSRLCMSSSVAGHQRAFGADAVPCCYEDLELADLIVLVGSNAAWCHPVLFQRIRAAKERRPEVRIVVIDPRRTDTCDIADLHLALAPGSDVALFNGLLHYLERHNAVDWRFLVNHTEGFGEALEAAQSGADPVATAALACDLPRAQVEQFYAWFAATPRTVSVYSQGVNQWSCGTDKVNAIINCHLATGRIGAPGSGPFSFTGQPNAMGGREVGGLANQLAAHRGFTPEDLALVRGFWGAPRLAERPGLKAVDLFQAVADGRVKALWVMATNPAVSLPDADRVREALRRCELLVVSDCERHTDTTALAHILLPAAAWGEKNGTVTNSERRISRQRAFLPAPGEARPDWWILTQVARRLGHAGAFPYEDPAEIFREHAALTRAGERGHRALDLGGLSGLDAAGYRDLAPIQWPVAADGKGSERLFADGQFFTPSGRVRFVPVRQRPPAHATDVRWPLVLNTGRVRDQWHTMTRSARAPRLNSHRPEPYLEIHPKDAEPLGLAAGSLAQVESRWGRMLARVELSARQRPGSVFVPMHWSDAFARSGRVGALVNPATDPHSGQPEFKHTPVTVAPATLAWTGFVLSRHVLALPAELNYLARTLGDGFLRYEIAASLVPSDWHTWAMTLLGPEGDWLEFRDAATGRYRAAVIRDGRLSACLIVSAGGPLPERDWLAALFAQALLTPESRTDLLAGKSGRTGEDRGRTICACFNVGLKTLERAIREQGLATVQAVGEALKAGTNCGSCVAEIREVIDGLD